MKEQNTTLKDAEQKLQRLQDQKRLLTEKLRLQVGHLASLTVKEQQIQHFISQGGRLQPQTSYTKESKKANTEQKALKLMNAFDQFVTTESEKLRQG